MDFASGKEVFFNSLSKVKVHGNLRNKCTWRKMEGNKERKGTGRYILELSLVIINFKIKRLTLFTILPVN
jgi:hypothetical protein